VKETDSSKTNPSLITAIDSFCGEDVGGIASWPLPRIRMTHGATLLIWSIETAPNLQLFFLRLAFHVLLHMLGGKVLANWPRPSLFSGDSLSFPAGRRLCSPPPPSRLVLREMR